MRTAIRHSLVISAVGILLYGIVVISTARMELGKGFSSVPAWRYLIVLALSLINYALRYWRWMFYLRRMGHSIPTMSALPAYLGGFCFTVSPGKVGEASRLLLFQDAGVPMSSTAGLIALERVVDIACLAILACLLAFAMPGFRWMITLSWLLAVAGLFLLARPQLLERLLTRCESRLPAVIVRVGRAVTYALESVGMLLQWKALSAGLAIGVVAWLAEGVGFALLGLWLAGPIGLAFGIGAYSVATLAGALSMLPGGLGSTEATMIGLLVLAGADHEGALLATLLCRAATLWFAVLIGGGAVLLIWRRAGWGAGAAAK